MGLTKVSTDGVKDNTINTAKIINGAIQTEDIADNQIRTDKILDGEVTLAKLPHGTSSNDGKFLRANNGADPTFETVTSTTINNNADNRVITGSGTANTLEGESGLTYSSNELTVTEQITVDSPDNVTSFAGDYALKLQGGDTINDVVNIRFSTDADGSLAQVSALAEATGAYPNSSGSLILSVQSGGAAYEGLRINSARNIGIGIASPAKKLHVFESGEARIRLETGDSRGQAFDLLSTNGAGTNTGTLSIRNESNQSFIDFSHNGGSPFTKIYNTGSQQFTFDSDGLKFGSDTAAANALDDYEQGTWTPDLRVASYLNNANSFTYTARTGIYTKIGNKVYINAYWQVSNYHTYSGNLYLFGLPFAPAQLASNINPILTIVGDGANLSGNDFIFALVEGGNSRAVLGHQGGTGWSHLVVSEVDIYGMYLSGNYEVS
mgnify:CR=1 FL=1